MKEFIEIVLRKEVPKFRVAEALRPPAGVFKIGTRFTISASPPSLIADSRVVSRDGCFAILDPDDFRVVPPLEQLAEVAE